VISPRSAILHAAAALLLAAPVCAQTDELPYSMEALADAGLELPVPVGWVRLPAEEGSGAEALFISVQDMGELDVFSMPFQCAFDESGLEDRAREIHDFVSPGTDWEGIATKLVTLGAVTGMSLRARWPRMDRPADVLAVAFPTRGRTALVLLVVASGETSPFDLVASLIEERTRLLAPPADGASSSAGLPRWEDGRGFGFDVPAGWRRVLDVEVEVLAGETGSDAGEGASGMVGFVRPGIFRQSPNLIVDLTPSLMPVSEEMLEQFEMRYRQLIGPRTSPFTLDSASIVDVAGRDSFRMEGRMEVTGLTVRQDQYFVPVGDHSLILTFSFPDTMAATLDPQVRGVLGSLVVSEPLDSAVEAGGGEIEETGRALHFVLGGACVFVLLVLAVYLVGRRRS
jgi:hypothetical protein